MQNTSGQLLLHFKKNMEKEINQTINQLVFSLMFQEYMKDTFIVNYMVTLRRVFFQNINVAFVKALVLNIPSSHDRKNENCS